MSKKRKNSKYPGLDKSVNLKSRRDYIDNIHYTKKLPEYAKQYLNDFNQAYYGNDRKLKYENFDIIQSKLSTEEYEELKKYLSKLRGKLRKICNKPAERTSEEDRQKAYVIREQVEELSEFLYDMVPTRKMTKDNYARNEDFLNMSKANNTYDLVSWEDLRDSELNEVQEESIFSPFKWEEED